MKTYGAMVVAVLLVLLLGVPAAWAQEAEPAAEPTVTAAGAEPTGQPEHVMKRLVVTATRLEQPVGQVAESATVITGQELQERQITTAEEALRLVPGLNVRASGPLGSATSISIRGSAATQALVMLDGVPLTDPTLASFDFSDLTADNIERIEIVRGPQSTLWGSESMGGTVNIITKRGKGTPTVSFGAELGRFSFEREFLSSSGGTERIDYALGISRINTDNHLENTDFQTKAGSLKIGLNPAESLRIELIMRSTEANSESPWTFPTTYAPLALDPNTTREHSTFTGIVNFIHTPVEWWDHRLRLSYLEVDSTFRDEPNVTDGDFFRSWNSAEVTNLDYQTNFHLADVDTLTFGVTHIDQEAVSSSESRFFGFDSTSMLSADIESDALYVQNQLRLFERVVFTAGIRFDDHEVFGDDTNGKASLAVLIPETGTRLRGSYGTGFRAPQVLELFEPFMGNPGLQPEQSEAWEVGFDQSFFEERLVFGATYFEQDYKDLIQYDPTLLLPGHMFPGAMNNVGRAKISGVELTLDAQVTEHLALNASYTHLDTEDEATGAELPRRPEDTGSLAVNYKRGPVNVNLSASLVSKSAEEGILDFDGTVIEPDSYAKVNLAASWDITKNIQVFGRIENLLDERYSEVQGFPEANPISGFGGVKITF